jgi:hypothetical protein
MAWNKIKDVKSSTSKRVYTISCDSYDPSILGCFCPAWSKHFPRENCKHLLQYLLDNASGASQSNPVTAPIPDSGVETYPTDGIPVRYVSGVRQISRNGGRTWQRESLYQARQPGGSLHVLPLTTSGEVKTKKKSKGPLPKNAPRCSKCLSPNFKEDLDKDGRGPCCAMAVDEDEIRNNEEAAARFKLLEIDD